MTSIPLSEMESSPSAKFVNVGDSYSGKIQSMTQRQQTDPSTGKPRFFDSGDPMMVWVITIEQADGERVALFASGGNYKPASGEGESMLSAIGAAVRAAGANAVDVGGELAVAHTGLGVQSPGKNAPRLYKAQYRPPTPVESSVPVDLFNQ